MLVSTVLKPTKILVLGGLAILSIYPNLSGGINTVRFDSCRLSRANYTQMHQQYLTYEQIEQQVESIAQQLKSGKWQPDLIVALSRGGLLPGVRLSYLLDLPCRAVNLSLRDHPTNQLLAQEWQQLLREDGRRVLVVDDINDSGDTILAVQQGWHPFVSGEFSEQVRFAVLLNKNSSSVSANYWAQMVEHSQQHIWWVFPWEIKSA